MASNYTANYGLCQWEPEDSFVRTEFNRDNEKIDVALAEARGVAEEARGGIGPLRYNLYNLLLRAYYERKNTDWKKGLLFDGFLDARGIAVKSEAVLLLSGGLCLSSRGQEDVILGYGSSRARELTTRSVVVNGNGTLLGLRYQVHSEMSVARGTQFDYTFTVNGSTKASGMGASGTVQPNASSEFTLSLPTPIQVKPGDTVQATLKVEGSAWSFHASSAGSTLGGTLVFQPISGDAGELTTVARQLPAASGLLAWIRHRGGAVGISVMEDGGTPRPLTLTGRRETTEPQNGAACTESAFVLEEATAEGDLAFRLNLELEGGTEMTVYDYGVILR